MFTRYPLSVHYHRVLLQNPTRNYATRVEPTFLNWKNIALGGGIFTVLLYTYLGTLQRKTISPEEFVPLTITQISPVNHNTSVFRLKFPTSFEEPLPTVSCFHIKDDLIQIMREYTPVSPSNEKHHIDFLIKRYDHGHMSRYIHSKKEGETLEVRGPFVSFPYTTNMKTHVGMICGGTGITPMYQIIDHICRNSVDKTKIYLIYANVAKQDILLFQELEQLSREHPDQLHIYYTLEKLPEGESWTQGIGYVTKEMVKNNIPGPQQDVLLLVCGPDEMVKHVSGEKARDLSQGPIGGLLGNIGYTQDQVFKF
ncbi:17078_t:CDS:2 [Acaulospora morrowiae]|uniref:NADH-cytochrome b5 reductase n=1 Tax=Acaulospora morrowiae TaxID=94023 RepID=A0A9N9GIL2_9GLOM|nr:17078_t:CDS:2 [Acaulospora morrowiae]